MAHCKKKFVYAPCGRQSGKTEICLRRLVRHLRYRRPWPDPRYFYAGPTVQQAVETAWERLLNLTPKHWITGVRWSTHTIHTVFGSSLFVTGLDRPQRIEGRILDGGVIDECCDIKEGTFDHSVLGTLVTRKGWCWFIGVCKRVGVGVREYRHRYELAAAGALPSSAGFQWPSAGIVPADYLEECRLKMDPYDFDEQFNAKWLTAAGGVFHSFDREYNVREVGITYDPNRTILVGMDFNVDPMCWIFCHLRNGMLEVFDELFIRNTNTYAALEVMLSRFRDHKRDWQLYIDASAKARHTAATTASASDLAIIANNIQLQSMHRSIHCLTHNPPVADRFAATNARICSGGGVVSVFIHSRCKHLIYDLETRSYKPGTREPADQVDEGHMTDALGYICYKKWPLRLLIQSDNAIITRKGPQWPRK